MNVYLETGIPARGIQRVVDALKQYSPSDIDVVKKRDAADLVIYHVVGVGNFEKTPIDELIAEDRKQKRRYAMIQYCFRTTERPSAGFWAPFWMNARCVWSYYDLARVYPVPRFYHAPLGISDAFRPESTKAGIRPVGVVTSGYVDGPHAEAISEVMQAAERAEMPVIHIGPTPEGVTPSGQWGSMLDITDEALSTLYQCSQFVSGLRHGEGFELPVIEGLACGARPIVFDRPEMRRWYEGFAEFVPECSGETLIQKLTEIFRSPARTVSEEERQRALRQFNWEEIVGNFWRQVTV